MAGLDNAADDAPEVVVVDDHPANLDLLVKLLGAQGYRVRAFPDAELALNSIRLSLPDLVLLDVGLPVMDGLEACRQMRANERTRDVPVIFLSARVGNDEVVQGFEAGGSDYVTKPIRERELLARVRVHVQVKKLQDRLRQQSMVDALTGLYNRRMLDETLQSEWRRNLRQQAWLGAILVDVDHFKAYNDRYGHQQGDLCLRSIAHAIVSTVRRSGDLVARYGGEEFALLLPNTDPAGTRLVAQRVLESVPALGIVHVQSPTAAVATISCGVASLVPTRGGSASSLIELADRRLYLAKQRGRNQIVFDDETDPSAVAGGVD